MAKAKRIRQAVVIIHGMGEHRPLDTLNQFIASGLQPIEGERRFYSRPDQVTKSYESRRYLAPRQPPNQARRGIREQTEFYEYHWAHLMQGNRLSDLWPSFSRMLLRPPWAVPIGLRVVWAVFWALLILAAIFFIFGPGSRIELTGNPLEDLLRPILGVGLVAITQVLSWVVLSVAGMRYGGQFLFGAEGRAAAVATAAGSAGAAGTPGLGILSVGIPPIPLWVGIALFLCFVLGFIFYASLFAAVGAMVNSQEDVQQAATPVMLLLVSSVVFMGPIMANPGSPMARKMSMLPTSAPIIMPLRITLVAVPWFEVVGALAGVAAACGIAIWLSGRIYRVGLLMYGKKPSFSELARWIRYAR